MDLRRHKVIDTQPSWAMAMGVAWARVAMEVPLRTPNREMPIREGLLS